MRVFLTALRCGVGQPGWAELKLAVLEDGCGVQGLRPQHPFLDAIPQCVTSGDCVWPAGDLPPTSRTAVQMLMCDLVSATPIPGLRVTALGQEIDNVVFSYYIRGVVDVLRILDVQPLTSVEGWLSAVIRCPGQQPRTLASWLFTPGDPQIHFSVALGLCGLMEDMDVFSAPVVPLCRGCDPPCGVSSSMFAAAVRGRCFDLCRQYIWAATLDADWCGCGLAVDDLLFPPRVCPLAANGSPGATLDILEALNAHIIASMQLIPPALVTTLARALNFSSDTLRYFASVVDEEDGAARLAALLPPLPTVLPRLRRQWMCATVVHGTACAVVSKPQPGASQLLQCVLADTVRMCVVPQKEDSGDARVTGEYALVVALFLGVQ